MKEMWKRFRIGAVAVSVCMMLLGLALMIWPETSAMTVCVILGIVCVAAGIYEIVRYFNLGIAGLFFRFDLGLGILYILAGILLLANPLSSVTLLPTAVGIYMLFSSVRDIQVSVEMRRFGLSNWLLALISGIAGVVLAFLLVLNPFTGASALMIYLGISLIVAGIENLCTVGCISRAVKSRRKDDILDVDWTDVL